MDRSISITRVLRRAFSTYVGQAAVLLPILAFAGLIFGVLAIPLFRFLPGLVLVAAIVDLAVISLFTGAVVLLVADIYDGGNVRNTKQLLRDVRPMLGQLMLVGFVAGLAVGVVSSVSFSIYFSLVLIAIVKGGVFHVAGGSGVIVDAIVGTVVLLVPVLLLLTFWSVAAPVVVLERPGGLRALGRSRELVSGSGMRVFGMLVLLAVPLAFVARVSLVISHVLGHGFAVAANLLVAILLAPVPMLVATVLYFELRRVAAEDLPAGATPEGAS